MNRRLVQGYSPGDGRLYGALFLSVAVFSVGCVLGFALGTRPRTEDEVLTAYLPLLLRDGTVHSLPLLFWRNVRWLLVLSLSGCFSAGLLMVPLSLLLRGTLFAFTVASLTRACGALGLKAAFLLVGLPALLWVPAQLMLGSLSLCSARSALDGRVGDGPLGVIGRACLPALLCWGISLISVLLECWCGTWTAPLFR